jgi:nucleoside 2-deoxyribosyltransferase
MSSKSIYLAGPIYGCDKGEANDWRNEIRAQIEPLGIRGISPLRCEPLVDKTYPLFCDDPRFGTQKAIGAKNELDVRACDMTLVYLPKASTEKRPSYGTIIELAWAYAFNKPTILVSDDPHIVGHPLTVKCAQWILPTLADAVTVIKGVYGDYVAKVA